MRETPASGGKDHIEALRELLAILRPYPGVSLRAEMSVDKLRSDLERAGNIMRLGQGLDDGGRAGVLVALQTVRQFVEMHLPSTDGPDLLGPVHYLIEALCELYDGQVLPVLQPKRMNHRKRIGRDARVFKASCIVAADIMYEHGASNDRPMSRKDADAFVRKHSEDQAKWFGLELTSRTLETWRNALRKERRLLSQGRRSALAADVESIREVFALIQWNAKAADSVAHALLELGDLIRHKVRCLGFAILPLDQEAPVETPSA